MARSRIALFLAAFGLLAGTLVGCGFGSEPKEDREGGETSLERSGSYDEGRIEGRDGDDEEDDDEEDGDEEDS
jgi:hypothetical protein